jgi:hypothetical protein
MVDASTSYRLQVAVVDTPSSRTSSSTSVRKPSLSGSGWLGS